MTDTICQTPLDPSTINSADAQFHHTLIGLICYGAVFISRASPVFVWTFCAALIGFIDLPSERSGSQSSPSAQITERLRPSRWYFTNFRAPLWPKLSNLNHSCANPPLCAIAQNVLIKKVWNNILEFKATLRDGSWCKFAYLKHLLYPVISGMIPWALSAVTGCKVN